MSKTIPSHLQRSFGILVQADFAGEIAPDAKDDPFIEDNFLSNELRIPVTLVGTYPGRALATNAMAVRNSATPRKLIG